MIEAGIYHTLKVNRISDYGLYLSDESGDEVLLPNRYVSIEDHIDDMVRVFVYHDSEDRLVATREEPLGTVGQVAMLRVVDKTVHGAFLDWGLSAKDLFMPNRNMTGYVESGRTYPVYIYRDDRTGRAVATMELRRYLNGDPSELERGQQVQVMVVAETETGYRAAIENRYSGMLYKNQLFRPVRMGEQMEAYVRKITEDGKIDLSLQQEGFGEVKDASDRLIKLLEENNGRINLNDNSSPEAVSSMTGMSKKVFKRTVGFLMKRGIISMSDKGIELIKNE